MSPNIAHAPAPLTPPLSILRAALKWARIEGIPVAAQPDVGVACVSRESERPWERDRLRDAVSPVGAAILMQQPRAPHVWAAACEVLGGSLPFSEAVQDGIVKATPNAERFGAAARLYLQGYETGLMVRRLVLTHEGA